MRLSNDCRRPNAWEPGRAGSRSARVRPRLFVENRLLCTTAAVIFKENCWNFQGFSLRPTVQIDVSDAALNNKWNGLT